MSSQNSLPRYREGFGLNLEYLQIRLVQQPWVFPGLSLRFVFIFLAPTPLTLNLVLQSLAMMLQTLGAPLLLGLVSITGVVADGGLQSCGIALLPGDSTYAVPLQGTCPNASGGDTVSKLDINNCFGDSVSLFSFTARPNFYSFLILRTQGGNLICHDGYLQSRSR